MFIVNNHYLYHEIDSIVEGIGSIKNSLLGHISDIPLCGTSYWENICFKENDNLLYINPNFENCFPIDTQMVNSVYSIKQKPSFVISPMPFFDEFTIQKTPCDKAINIEIFNVTGKKVYKSQMTQNNYKIKLLEETGIYILKITDINHNLLLSKKLIKE